MCGAGERAMRKAAALGIAILAVLVVAGIGAWYLLASGRGYGGAPDPITVAYSPFESTALFWIAVDQHFLEKNGLNVSLRSYNSGPAALEGMLDGEADIAVGTSEFPLVGKAFQKARVRAMGNIDKGSFIYLVGRRDRGIGNVSDLKGKRIGTTFGTVAEFHLGRFLLLHGIEPGEVHLVDVTTPEDWVNAVATGDIDAIATAQPYANEAGDRLGANAITWPVQSSQPVFGLVISTDDWIKAHPEQARRFLGSLAQAEEFATTHPDEAKAIVQRRLGLDPGYMEAVWQQNQFTLSLDQSLVLAMEDEARWMIANNLTDATSVPDFRDYLYPDCLEAVKPGSVNIIR